MKLTIGYAKIDPDWQRQRAFLTGESIDKPGRDLGVITRVGKPWRWQANTTTGVDVGTFDTRDLAGRALAIAAGVVTA